MTAVKGAVPLVPNTAGAMLNLGAANNLKARLAVLALEVEVEWRGRIEQVDNFAPVFQTSVGSSDGGLAKLANRDK